MGKAPFKLNAYFAEDFNPPLLAETQHIRIELRKEKNHHRPHVHVIKKVKDVSIAIDDLSVLAGEKNLKYFDRDELLAIADFIFENQDRFMQIYNNLRGDL
jgi:hypothetical protein